MYNKSRNKISGHYLHQTKQAYYTSSTSFTEFEPTYCMAVTTQKGDSRVYRHVRQCTEKLPALCAATDMTSEDILSTYLVEIPGLDSNDNTSNSKFCYVMLRLKL